MSCKLISEWQNIYFSSKSERVSLLFGFVLVKNCAEFVLGAWRFCDVVGEVNLLGSPNDSS